MDKKPLISRRKTDRAEHECCELYKEYCYPCKTPNSTDEKKKK